jgi:putative transposase
MGKKHFSEEQIAFALRQAESGTSVAEVIRKLGISEQTFYRWKTRFAGLGIAELRRLRTLEEENRELKQLVADLNLDKKMLQDVLSKNFEARGQACSRAGSTGLLPGGRASGMPGARICSIEFPLQEQA